jgi:putative transposase
VQPSTLVRWHRLSWRIFWRWKCRVGRPPFPRELRELIRRIATENPLWGEERIANKLLVKLGIRVSPRTVDKYMPKRPRGERRGDQRWSTSLKNHAKTIFPCDFFTAVTATFRMLYVFVVIDHGTRRLAQVNVTAHPSAGWTLQQLRDVIGDNNGHHQSESRHRLAAGCARPCEVDLTWLAPRILACYSSREYVVRVTNGQITQDESIVERAEQ